jgi:hypothetical protein
VDRRALKVLTLLLLIGMVAFAAVCIWWKTACDAQRAPCAIDIGPITLRIGDDAK